MCENVLNLHHALSTDSIIIVGNILLLDCIMLVIWLKDLGYISTCSHHDLVHSTGMLGHERTHIIHLMTERGNISSHRTLTLFNNIIICTVTRANTLRPAGEEWIPCTDDHMYTTNFIIIANLYFSGWWLIAKSDNFKVTMRTTSVHTRLNEDLATDWSHLPTISYMSIVPLV